MGIVLAEQQQILQGVTMKKHKYFTKNIDNGWQEIDEDVANDVIRQYVERKYIGTLIAAAFIIGFLCGVIASA